MKKTRSLLSEKIPNCEPWMEDCDKKYYNVSAFLRVCCEKKALHDGMRLHDHIIREHGYKLRDVYVNSLLVHMYGKCGDLYDAHAWFVQMHEKTLFSWNCLLGAYVQYGNTIESDQLFEQMQQECMIPNNTTFANMLSSCAKHTGKRALCKGLRLHAQSMYNNADSGVVVHTSLISMYNKCGQFLDACGVFDTMLIRDTVAWNAMLAAIVMQSEHENAIQLFAQMQMESALWDQYTYVTVFSACATRKTLRIGKQIHACIFSIGLEISNVLRHSLVNMYAKSASVSNARAVFDASMKQEIVLWNVMIMACAQNDDVRGALQLFDGLYQEGLLPDKVTFLNTISEPDNNYVRQGLWMHTRVIASIWNSDIQVQTALLHMYGKLGSSNDAHKMFDNMFEWDVVCWNAMISVHVQHGLSDIALQHFNSMQEEGMLPNNVTITTILSSFTDGTFLSVGKHIHSQIFGNGMKSDVFVGNALISMYAKCGHMKDAHEQFDSMLSRDNITWNTLIGGYAQSDDAYVVMNLFGKMCLQGIPPDQATYVSMLSAFVNESFWVVDCKESDFAMKALVVPYVVNNSDILENKEAWNDENTGENTQSFIATKKYRDLDHDFHGSQSYWDFRLHGGRLMHTHIVCNGLDSDLVINNALLKFYGNCSSLRDMEVMFERLSIHNVLSFNSIIMAYAQHHFEAKAIEMFDKMATEKVSPDNIAFVSILEACSNVASLIDGMQIHVKIMQHGFDSDVNVATAMMNLYAKCGSLVESKWIFDHMPKRDLITWTSMIATFVQFTRGEEALHLFGQMQREGLAPDVVCFTNVLHACEILLALLDGRLIHTCITYCHVESEVDLATTLLFMYGRCGSLSDAQAIFHRILNRSLGLWNAMIAAFAQHGHGQEAFELFNCMHQQGCTPNKTTFVIIMSACSRAGLLEESYHCLFFLFRESEVTPCGEHADCMIDLLGRVGQIDEAEIFINVMPFLPNGISWAAFMAACNNRVDVKRGNVALNHLVEMDPIDPVTYVALSNLYASVEEVECGDISIQDEWIDPFGSSDAQLVWEDLV